MCRANFDYFKISDWSIVPHGVQQVWPSYDSKSIHLQLSKSSFIVILILFVIIRRDVYSTIHDWHYFPHEEKRKYLWGKKLLTVFYPPTSFLSRILLKTPYTFPYLNMLMRLIQFQFEMFFPQDSKVFYPLQHFSFLKMWKSENDHNSEDRLITVSRRESIDSTSRP